MGGFGSQNIETSVMSRSKIYNGTVEQLMSDGIHALVKLSDQTECGACPLAGACATNSPRQIIEAVIPSGITLRQGVSVTISCPNIPLLNDKWMWVLIPCTLLIITTLIMQAVTADYTVVTTVSLLATALYFIIAGLWRATRKHRQRWVIKSVKP